MNVITIVGARPQFIKAAPLSTALQNIGIKEVIIHTGQHYDRNMSEIFFEELGIPKPKYNINVGSGHHGFQTGKMLENIERILLDERPEMVIVYGDTNSTLAGALAAAKLHIPLAHIESGLRSHNRYMPEEINRILTDHCSSLLFAPTETSANNLKREGLADDKIYVSGDIMLDATLAALNIVQTRIQDECLRKYEKYVLVTIHRAENTDDESSLRRIYEQINLLSEKVTVIMPIHPRTKSKLNSLGLLEKKGSNLIITDPMGYLDMIESISNAEIIVTDSGGLQKEAYFLKKLCITIRNETEWTELVESGWNVLAPPSKDLDLCNIYNNIQKPNHHIPFYGEGKASEFIASKIKEFSRPI